MRKIHRCTLWVAVMLCLCTLSSAAAELYIFPDSNTRELTEAEIWAWDYESLEYAFNEIFARHGYVFEPGGKFEAYFSRMPWYTPNANPDNQVACYPYVSALEWRNEHRIKAAREEMELKMTDNPKGKSVWNEIDVFRITPEIEPSDVFSTLVFQKVDLLGGQLLPVYAAPSAAAYRGAKNQAAVGTNGEVYAAGWENGWLLIMYETNKGGIRIGFIEGAGIVGSVPVLTQLVFQRRAIQVTARCIMTDDPLRNTATQTMTRLNKGAAVTYLATYTAGQDWAYVETQVDGKTARGFVPLNALDIPVMQDDGLTPNG